jgi:thiol-disulfide isomerase/thioredoxin
MSVPRILACFTAAFLLIGLTGCQPKVQLPVLGHAPAWKLRDLDGKEISSDQYLGKVVLLDFWATWCVPCSEEMPSYIRLQEKYGRDKFTIIGISLDEAGAAHEKQFVTVKGVNYPIVLGKLDEVEALFGGMEALPTKLQIDQNGEIRDRTVGADPALLRDHPAGSHPSLEYEKKIKALL